MDANAYVLVGYGLMAAGALACLLILTWALLWMSSHEDDAAQQAEVAIAARRDAVALDALQAKAEDHRRRLALIARRDR